MTSSPGDAPRSSGDASRPLRRDAAENRAGILVAARAVLAADPRASLDAIARTAGLSRRALYGHFADRDALVRELVAHGAQRFNAIPGDIDEPDPRVALARLAARLWNEAAHVQVLAAIALDDAHVSKTAEALAPVRQALLTIIEEGRRQEVLRTDVPAATLARVLEETARAIMTRMDAAAPDAGLLAVRAVLSIAGLSWREAADLLAAHPVELANPADASAEVASA